MTNAIRTSAAVCAVLCLAACTTVDVSPVPASGYPITEICIERNPAVVIEDFLPVVEQAIARHGIATRALDAPLPADCAYTLWYTARRRWDIWPRLGYAELRVRFHGETIGTASYLSEPSLSPFKWRSTEAMIAPVVDELFAQFAQPTHSSASKNARSSRDKLRAKASSPSTS